MGTLSMRQSGAARPYDGSMKIASRGPMCQAAGPRVPTPGTISA
jgi:hypothetical protein